MYSQHHIHVNFEFVYCGIIIVLWDQCSWLWWLTFTRKVTRTNILICIQAFVTYLLKMTYYEQNYITTHQENVGSPRTPVGLDLNKHKTQMLIAYIRRLEFKFLQSLLTKSSWPAFLPRSESYAPRKWRWYSTSYMVHNKEVFFQTALHPIFIQSWLSSIGRSCYSLI